MKRVVTIQDISCIGKCSLTVALPIISCMGIETAIIPSAILSTHTAFKNFTFRDLSEDILPVVKHWKEENLTFDAVYTGYLGSIKQIEIIEEAINTLEHKKVIVDPVMADHGRFYTGFNKEYALKMKELCIKADVVLPNLTEACLMLDIPYKDKDYSKEYIQDILKEMVKIGIKNPIITGVGFKENLIGAMAYIGGNDEFYEYYNTRLDMTLHGTGDIFASVFTGAYILSDDLKSSINLAVDFVSECMKNSENDRLWYGANFEVTLPYLMERIKRINSF